MSAYPKWILMGELPSVGARRAVIIDMDRPSYRSMAGALKCRGITVAGGVRVVTGINDDSPDILRFPHAGAVVDLAYVTR